MRPLELLAPARDPSIGIAAIDCGADAVYIGGPSFGARKDAGNLVEDFASLCGYAHSFGSRVFATLNTILFEDELAKAENLIIAYRDAGVDALIVQDLAVVELCRRLGASIPLHASTQCAVRTPGAARFYEDLGFSRIVLERELSLEQISAIREAVDVELECFVHGALCVCYSGQCYLSEYLSGRSANRGACVQACRSRYDLLDGDGRVLSKEKALLSLKDLELLSRMEDLVDAGVCSFKIEGRLKGASYVRNVVLAYSKELDRIVSRNPAGPDGFRRSSYGSVSGGFVPDLRKTFNRGYTQLYIDGVRSRGWSSMDSAGSTGEFLGTVSRVTQLRSGNMEVTFAPEGVNPPTLTNGDGFCTLTDSGVIGFRGDVCRGTTIQGRRVPGVSVGQRFFRTSSAAFEKQMQARPSKRQLMVAVQMEISCIGASPTAGESEYKFLLKAFREDGTVLAMEHEGVFQQAKDIDRMRDAIVCQVSKEVGRLTFVLENLILSSGSYMPFVPTSTLNGFRRDLAAALEATPVQFSPLPGPVARKNKDRDGAVPIPSGLLDTKGKVTYKANVANSLARDAYIARGALEVAPAYEMKACEESVELMRTRYCIRYELGLCLKTVAGRKVPGPLRLRNNGRLLALGFDCSRCEMTVGQGTTVCS